MYILVLFVSSLGNEVVFLYVCVVCSLFCNRTKWFSCLHLAVLFFVVLFSKFVSIFGLGLKMQIVAENSIQEWFQHISKGQKWPKHGEIS